MLLLPEKTLCEKNAKRIVSKDKGTPGKHMALNEKYSYDVRHYKLDGEVVKQEACCDFLLLNDTNRVAYFIELKGRNINDAVPQLKSAENMCRQELSGYTIYYRIVASKVRTHEIQKTEFRKFKDKCGSRLKYATDYMEEEL